MRRISERVKWLVGGGLVVAAVVAVPLLQRHVRTNTTEAALEVQLAQGSAYVDSLVAGLSRAPISEIRPADAAAMLYLERLRLGLGSPFRLIDQALRDSELEQSRRLALGMLARTLRGETYQIEPAALRPVARDAAPDGIGALHLALIDSVVATERDPRVGELRVRLAYRLAMASGAVSRRAPEIATSAAAQLRDRRLAARDARELIAAAARRSGDLVAVLREWREARRLLVERPVIVPLSARAERDAVEGLPGLIARLEALAKVDRQMVAASDSTASDSMPRDSRPAPSEALARRMVAVAKSRDLPPQAPIAVTLTGYGPLIRSRTGPAAERAARARFASEPRNEEELVAEYALLRARHDRELPAAAVTLLTAGVALRPYAQERAWLHGDEAPTARDLHVGFGITVSYDSTVRPSWRPYLRRALALALTDLRRVLTSYDPRGLRVHFGESPLRERALALHDPVKRIIYFPPWTSSGVMAHEFAHDLDWLAGRRHHNSPGWYRTDRAMRQASDQLSGALRQMASAMHAADTTRSSPQQRPTEIFARNVDWFVSAALARENRLNGYLSAVQDPVLTGYASATTPEAAYEGGSATLRALGGMTSIPPYVRTWFSELFGTGRRTSVHEAVRIVLETPLSAGDLPSAPRIDLWAPSATTAMMRAMPVTSGAWACLLDPFVERSGDEEATRTIIELAAEARARGVVSRWSELARRYPALGVPALRGLGEPPRDPAIGEDLTRQVRDAILWRALAARSSGTVTEALAASGVLRAPAGCASAR